MKDHKENWSSIPGEVIISANLGGDCLGEHVIGINVHNEQKFHTSKSHTVSSKRECESCSIHLRTKIIYDLECDCDRVVYIA